MARTNQLSLGITPLLRSKERRQKSTERKRFLSQDELSRFLKACRDSFRPFSSSLLFTAAFEFRARRRPIRVWAGPGRRVTAESQPGLHEDWRSLLRDIPTDEHIVARQHCGAPLTPRTSSVVYAITAIATKDRI